MTSGISSRRKKSKRAKCLTMLCMGRMMRYSVDTAMILLFMYLGTFICSTESVHTESVLDTVLSCVKDESRFGYSFLMDKSTLDYVQANITKSDIGQLLSSTRGKRALSMLRNCINPSLFGDFVNTLKIL